MPPLGPSRELNRVRPDESDFRRRLRCELLAYWVKNPEAKDTADGIRLWWLRGWAGLDPTVLMEELDTLMRKGWITERGPERTGRVFVLNVGQINSILDFIRNETEGAGSALDQQGPKHRKEKT